MSFNSTRVYNNFEVPAHVDIVTPSDTVDLVQGGVLYCKGSGEITVELSKGGTFTYVVEDEFLPLLVKKVLETGTDSGLVIGVHY